MRASELAGVCWQDINWEKKTVNFNKAYMRIKKYKYKNGKLERVETKKEFKDLKTENSYRIIGLPDKMIELLKIHKEKQKELARRNRKEFTEQDWVFTTKTYKGYVNDFTSDKFRKVMDILKIDGYKELTAHKLRHTFCTLGIKNGTRVEEMKEILGHSSIAVTSNWYLHLDKEKVVEASRNVNNFIEEFM